MKSFWIPFGIVICTLFTLGFLGNVPASPFAPTDNPPDPTADIPWSPANFNTVADIQTAFNNARTQENAQLGLSIPLMTLPSQATWDAMTEGQRAIYLVNLERVDRGVLPLEGLETNVTGVAQTYANLLLSTDQFSHTADGTDPIARMNANAAIGACHDFLPIAENLAYFNTTDTSIPMTLERSIYGWMYEDGACCGWGHRHAMLYFPYNNNSGSAANEGFLGLGRAKGGPYQGLSYAEITVMDVFDPCSTWTPTTPPLGDIKSYLPALLKAFLNPVLVR